MALIKAKKILYSTEYVKINAVKKYKINPKKLKYYLLVVICHQFQKN